MQLNVTNINKIKRVIFFLSLWPILSIAISAYNDSLGANPVEFIERHFGLWTLIFLCLTLSITPLSIISNQKLVISFRRMIGLYSFFYACIHLMAYLWIDYMFDWSEITKDIIKHRYVLIGFGAWLLMLPLAITSTNRMIKRLRQNWKLLHRLIYLIAIFGVLHFFWLVKKDYSEPMIYAFIVFLLLLFRFIYSLKKSLS
jgi:sulfoxide reductase heme-binding subunit YedZ